MGEFTQTCNSLSTSFSVLSIPRCFKGTQNYKLFVLKKMFQQSSDGHRIPADSIRFSSTVILAAVADVKHSLEQHKTLTL